MQSVWALVKNRQKDLFDELSDQTTTFTLFGTVNSFVSQETNKTVFIEPFVFSLGKQTPKL
ncbi:hypothetical protein BZG11_06530 [Salinivibrio kushneri]|nr:hypothetical protein BZG10_13245 [Salinivibrio kushneri]OOE51687.1 hypothetical protein BZG11_06530 [Salinivibrio kushneri]OOE60533.1 hypothetical protein BZG18_11285 [Salinivibrio kushneri]